MTVSNPYVQYLLEKGYTRTEANKVQRSRHTFPLKMYGRTFNTEEEYKEALADFMNGM